MRLPLSLVALALTTQACIIYDRECPGCDGDTGFEDRDHDWTDDEDTGDPPDAPSFSYGLTPNEAEAGDVFIGSLRVEGEDAPGLEEITDLRFYGDVEVLTQDVREDELLLTLSVAEAAEAGPVDLLVELGAEEGVFVYTALMLYPAGSGHSAGSSDDGSNPCE